MTDTPDNPERLTDLAAQINAAHAEVIEGARRSLEHAFKVGELLIKAKRLIEQQHGGSSYGHWMGWVAQHCAFEKSTGEYYMRVAEHRAEIEAKAKSQPVGNLTLRGALALIKKPRKPSPPKDEDEDDLPEAEDFTPSPPDAPKLIADGLEERERLAREDAAKTEAELNAKVAVIAAAGEDTGETEESITNACVLQVGQAISAARKRLSPEAQDRLLNRLRKKLPVVLPENAEEDGPVRDMFDRMVERLGGELALEMSEFLWSVQEGHWQKGGQSDRTKYADVWDTATYTKYPELNPHIGVMEEGAGAHCDHCGKPGGNEVAAGDGRQVRLHRECEDAWRTKEAA
jgi:hypothetical protein